MMQRICSSLLSVGISLTSSIIAPLASASSLAQTQPPQVDALVKLLAEALQQSKQGKHQQAISIWQQALNLAQKLKNRRAEAFSLLGIGFDFNAIGQPQKALEYFIQTLSILKEVGERVGEGTTLNNIGSVYSDIGQPQKALEYYIQSLTICKELSDRSGEATTLNNIGSVYNAIGQRQKALEHFTQAFSIFKELGDRSGETTTLNNIGSVYNAIGQRQKALEHFTQAFSIFKELGDRSGEATTLNNIGSVYSIDQPQKALEYYTKALSIHKDVGDRIGEATSLSSIGEIYRDIGQRQEALEYYTKALSIHKDVGDRAGEATSLSNIGLVYRAFGQPQKALEYHIQSLAIDKEVGNRAGEATSLSNIGVVYGDIGQPQKALEYYIQSLTIRKELGNRAGEATSLSNIGVVYDDIEQPQKALEYFTEALSIFKELGDRNAEASALANIGTIYSGIGQIQKALEYLTQALPIHKEMGNRAGEATALANIGTIFNAIGQPQKALEYYMQVRAILKEVGNRIIEAKVLANIGEIYRDIGQPEQALASLEQSLSLTLETRSELTRENRSDFLNANLRSANALVSLLVDQNQPKRAFQWANLATTADLADYSRLINARVANPTAQATVDKWNQQNQQLQLLRQQLQEPGKFSETLSRQIREKEAQVNQIAEKIAKQFPEVAELFETKPTDIAQLQASIPAGTTVIQPIIVLTNVKTVPDTVALFILTQDSLSVKKIPVEPKQLDLLFSQTYSQLINRFDDSYQTNLTKLYDLLIRPIEAQIQATKPKQLSIIATGKLRYIPFEALYDSKIDQYLIQKYPINYVTRLSVNALKGLQDSHSTPLQRKNLLALANPVPKVPLDLPGAEEEVKQIFPIFPSSQTLVRSDATLNAFKLQSPRFSLLHLATHGCFQKGGCPKLGLEENTLLFADQRFNIADAALLGLQNVDLITLSACQTALQTNSNGEEIAGLAYLFERAGAKAIIASLWSADDSTTQAIMVQFYTNLKNGMNKSESLRQAKLSQIDSHPFFWAPFVLIGDPR